jgi:hypothetical protein
MWGALDLNGFNLGSPNIRMKFGKVHYFLAGVLVAIVVVLMVKKTTEGFQQTVSQQTLNRIGNTISINDLKLSDSDIRTKVNQISNTNIIKYHNNLVSSGITNESVSTYLNRLAQVNPLTGARIRGAFLTCDRNNTNCKFATTVYKEMVRAHLLSFPDKKLTEILTASEQPVNRSNKSNPWPEVLKFRTDFGLPTKAPTAAKIRERIKVVPYDILAKLKV